MNYKRKYIDTGSPRPLYDVLIYGFFFSYLVAWPQVRTFMRARCSKKVLAQHVSASLHLIWNTFVPQHAGC